MTDDDPVVEQPLIPWAPPAAPVPPIQEPPPGGAGSADLPDPSRPTVPPPPPPRPSMTSNPGEAPWLPPGPMPIDGSPHPDLRTMLGPAPLGKDGFPLYGPGSLPPVRLRGFARIIDTLLVWVPVVAVLAVFFVTTNPDGELVVDTVPLWALLVARGVDVLYHTILLSATGTTVGKAIMGLRVEDPSGGRPGFQRSLLRALLPGLVALIPVVGLGIAILGYLTAEHQRLRQHLYDRAAGTVAVSTR